MTAGLTSLPRRLIVNADDFGQSPGINAGIIRCHEEGVLTSASLLVRWPDAVGAAASARQRPAMSVGLHIDLGEWAYADGEWVQQYSVIDSDDSDALAEELARQLEAFRRLMDANPTHLDSHQHVHRSAPVDQLAREMGTRLGVDDAPGMYVRERRQEVDVLCDPRVRAAIEARGTTLISFHDIGARSC